MIYKGYIIGIQAPEWNYYHANKDGTIGNFIDSGGIDTAAAEYLIIESDGKPNPETIYSGIRTLEEVKAVIDSLAAET